RARDEHVAVVGDTQPKIEEPLAKEEVEPRDDPLTDPLQTLLAHVVAQHLERSTLVERQVSGGDYAGDGGHRSGDRSKGTWWRSHGRRDGRRCAMQRGSELVRGVGGGVLGIAEH